STDCRSGPTPRHPGTARAGRDTVNPRAMIRFEQVQHRYGARGDERPRGVVGRGLGRARAAPAPADRGEAVLDGLSFEVAEGELLAVIGASGAGKTTLLKLINRLLEPTAGRVLVAGEDVGRRDPIALRRSIGYVFQRFGLFPHLTLA